MRPKLENWFAFVFGGVFLVAALSWMSSSLGEEEPQVITITKEQLIDLNILIQAQQQQIEQGAKMFLLLAKHHKELEKCIRSSQTHQQAFLCLGDDIALNENQQTTGS